MSFAKEEEEGEFCITDTVLQGASVAAVPVSLANLFCRQTKRGKFLYKCVFNVKKMLKLTVPQVEVVGGPGGPQPHGVHGVVHVAGDGRVVRHRQNHLHGRTVQTVSQQENTAAQCENWEETTEIILTYYEGEFKPFKPVFLVDLHHIVVLSVTFLIVLHNLVMGWHSYVVVLHNFMVILCHFLVALRHLLVGLYDFAIILCHFFIVFHDSLVILHHFCHFFCSFAWLFHSFGTLCSHLVSLL